MPRTRRDLFAPVLANPALIGPLLLLGRLFTTVLFIYYGLNVLTKPHPDNPILYAALLIQVVGVVMVALGYRTRLAALVMAAYCIVTTIAFRARPEYLEFFMQHYMKDLAVAAGFMFMYVSGPGPMSLDAYLNRDDARPLSDDGVVVGLVMLVGRLLEIMIFAFAGQNKIFHNDSMRAYMVRHNPHVPPSLLSLAIVTQVVAPTLVVLGYKTRWAAVALAGFCIIATVLFHTEFSNPTELINFLLDFGIAGGCGFLFAFGPGRFSIDAR